MQIEEENDLIITKEDGTEELLKILFYFHNDERGRDYYFLYRPEDPESVFVLSSEDGVKMEELTEEEQDEAEQVFEAYQDDPKIAEAKK